MPGRNCWLAAPDWRQSFKEIFAALFVRYPVNDLSLWILKIFPHRQLHHYTKLWFYTGKWCGLELLSAVIHRQALARMESTTWSCTQEFRFVEESFEEKGHAFFKICFTNFSVKHGAGTHIDQNIITIWEAQPFDIPSSSEIETYPNATNVKLRKVS